MQYLDLALSSALFVLGVLSFVLRFPFVKVLLIFSLACFMRQRNSAK